MKLFVHIPKNGGMSIRHGASDLIRTANSSSHISADYTTRLARTMTAAGEHHGYEHARLRDWNQSLRNNYDAFAIVRNPWERVVSRYTFSTLAEKKKYSFAEFLEERHIYGGREFYWHRAIRGWYPALDYVVDEEGELGCDVLRFGTNDIEKYLELANPLPRRNVSNVDKLDYRDFYGPDEHDIVADWYKQDIDYFGFTFDGGATRNIWKPTS